MRDEKLVSSLLRLQDDFETKKEAARDRGVKTDNLGFYLGIEYAMTYAINELKKVLSDSNT